MLVVVLSIVKCGYIRRTMSKEDRVMKGNLEGVVKYLDNMYGNFIQTVMRDPEDDEVIVVQYPAVSVSRNEITHIADAFRKSLKQRFPNNDVVFIPNDINVGSFNSREVIDHLRSLADKLEKEHNENID